MVRDSSEVRPLRDGERAIGFLLCGEGRLRPRDRARPVPGPDRQHKPAWVVRGDRRMCCLPTVEQKLDAAAAFLRGTP